MSAHDFLKSRLTVAVLGSGGREHALAWKIAQSPHCARVITVPGNAGMKTREGALIARVAVDPLDATARHAVPTADALVAALKREDVDFVVIGPDEMLAADLAGILSRAGFLVFGPDRAAARLEWSKGFAKSVMDSCGVPNANALPVTLETLGVCAERLGGYPLVLKFDGLALGKGVRVCAHEAEAREFLRERGNAGVFAEQFLAGREVSLFAVCDGERFLLLEPACDYKRLLDGDRGPNTGGMGAYSPVPWITGARKRAMSMSVFPRVLAEMRKRGTPFKGLLYAGLMVGTSGFHVLEFNARFGDPETQALMPRLKSDLLPALHAAARGDLSLAPELEWSGEFCVNVVAASRGYPEKAETGFAIRVEEDPNAFVFFAGVREGLVTSGGRVLSVSALGPTLEEARARAIAALSSVRFEGMQYRRDIAVGARA
ncbi:MAG: phosphoribosylamine--glycine ligase [Deltaproteobacteria bacterium]|nr:phosphoribosylamine--glycine ligase [Deltaproteobacteria bacterium]